MGYLGVPSWLSASGDFAPGELLCASGEVELRVRGVIGDPVFGQHHPGVELRPSCTVIVTPACRAARAQKVGIIPR
jgi:hypothetical protein